MNNKLPVVVLIGAGSKLPPLIKTAKQKKSKFKISLVVSHKKNSPGINLALKNKIPAVFFNLPDFRNKLSYSEKEARQIYCKFLGWFVSQKQYNPCLLIFCGWDLIMDENFFNFFKGDIGNGFNAINIHPGIMPLKNETEMINLPDGTQTPVIRGEQQVVLETVLKSNLTYFGPTVHFMNPKNFDIGDVIVREFIKVGDSKTLGQLRKKLLPVEDKILLKSIDTVLKNL